MEINIKNQLKKFWLKWWKQILIALIVVILGIGAYITWMYFGAEFKKAVAHDDLELDFDRHRLTDDAYTYTDSNADSGISISGMTNDINLIGGGCGSGDSGSSDFSQQCVKKHRVHWANDPDLHSNDGEDLQSNPFAKSNGNHCRTGSQCNSSKCEIGFCV